MKSVEEYVKENYDMFDDLCKRLQNDYNGEEDFKQYEEDRLILCNLLDIVDYEDNGEIEKEIE